MLVPKNPQGQFPVKVWKPLSFEEINAGNSIVALRKGAASHTALCLNVEKVGEDELIANIPGI